MNEVPTGFTAKTNTSGTHVLLSKIFYRPSEVFADQKRTKTWGRILLLLLAIHLVDSAIMDLSPTRQNSGDSIERFDREELSETSEPNSTGAPVQAEPEVTTETNTLYKEIENSLKITFFRFVTSIPSMFEVVFLLIALYFVLLIEALYLRIVSALLGLELKLGQWLALVSWSRVPGGVLMLLMSILFVSTLSISNDLFGIEMPVLSKLLDGSSTSFPSFGYFFDIWLLPEMWVIALQTLGFRAWTGRTTIVSFSIVVAPFVLLHALFGWLRT